MSDDYTWVTSDGVVFNYPSHLEDPGDEEEEDGGAGVREPRNPKPDRPLVSAAVPGDSE